jgi:hypothetical protein
MAIDLRPLSLGELLDRAFSLYRRHFWLFVGIMALPSAIGLALNLLVELMNRSFAAPAPDPESLADAGQALALVGMMMIGLVVGLLVYFAVYAVALGTITLAVSELYQEREVTIRAAYERLRPQVGRLVWLMLLMGTRLFAVVFLGLILVGVLSGVLGRLGSPLLVPLVLVPGMLLVGGLTLFMMLRWGVAVPAAVLEDRGGSSAIERSIQLTRGRLGRVFVLVVLTTIIAYAAILIFQGPFWAGAALAGMESTAGFWILIGGTIMGAIGQMFTAPIMIVGLALLYYDARVREEGLDLQLMMAALDAGQPPHPARG